MGSTISQSDWQVDSSEVQGLVNALKNHIRKPNLDYHRRRSTYLLVTAIAIAVLTAVLGTMFSMLRTLILVGGASLTITFLVWSYSERVRDGVTLLTIDWITVLDHGKIIKSRLIQPSNMLVPLYAVKLLYGEDPSKEKPKVEEFEPGPYCGKFLQWHITLPLNSSTVEIWKGFAYDSRFPDQYFVIIGNQYDRKNILRAIKYYLYVKYKYIEGQDYYTELWRGFGAEFMGAAKVEIKLCQERDKIPEKIARGEKIPIPPGPSYDVEI
jgi:hypothetical protein